MVMFLIIIFETPFIKNDELVSVAVVPSPINVLFDSHVMSAWSIAPFIIMTAAAVPLAAARSAEAVVTVTAVAFPPPVTDA
jgi:hypothetical protein